jgi:hypothetical protein
MSVAMSVAANVICHRDDKGRPTCGAEARSFSRADAFIFPGFVWRTKRSALPGRAGLPIWKDGGSPLWDLPVSVVPFDFA